MIIAFIIIQILLDLYFFYFMIVANTCIGILYDNIPTLSALDVVNEIRKNLDEEDKNGN